MAFGTYRCPCKILGCVSKPISSTPSGALLLLHIDLNKLANAPTLPPRFLNSFAVVFGGFGASLKVSRNEGVLNIIWTLLEARPITKKDPCKRLFKARFSDFYRDNNHIVYYNFC